MTQRQQTEGQLGGEVRQQDGEQGGTLPRQLAPAVGEKETIVDTDAEDEAERQHPEQGERLAAGGEQRQPHGQRNQVDQQHPGRPGRPHPPPEQQGHQADSHRQQLRKLDPVVGEQLAPLAALILPVDSLLGRRQRRQCPFVHHPHQRHPDGDAAIVQRVPQQAAPLADRAGQPGRRGQPTGLAGGRLQRQACRLEPAHHLGQQCPDGGGILVLARQRRQPAGKRDKILQRTALFQLGQPAVEPLQSLQRLLAVRSRHQEALHAALLAGQGLDLALLRLQFHRQGLQPADVVIHPQLADAKSGQQQTAERQADTHQRALPPGPEPGHQQ
ncbi:hypothetical protein D3C80_550020 [compost metagenome]